MPAGELAPCVFCGEPILPGEETAGRAPMAAHARCADAALADDDHWEAIAAGGDEGSDDGSEGTAPRAAATRQAGCLGILTLVSAAALAVGTVLLPILH